MSRSIQVANSPAVRHPLQPISSSPSAVACPLRIISDVHLGHPVSFVETPDQLAPLLEGMRTLVFNGDSVEMRFPGEGRTGRDRAESLREFCLERGVQPIFLNGNHDPSVSATDHLDLLGGRVLVMHGDALFESLSPWSPRAGVIAAAHRKEVAALGSAPTLEQRLTAAKRAAVAVGIRKPVRARSFSSRLLNIFGEMFPPRRPYLILCTWLETPRLAAAFAREFRPDARIIVIGHIHAPSIRKSGGTTVINTGCYLPPLWRTCVDIEDGWVTVRRVVQKKDGSFHPGATVQKWGSPPS